MTDTATQPETDSLTRLSDILNKLAGRGALSLSDTAAERQKLADMALTFNGASVPVAEKLAESLPGLSDYGSRWIAARMLRDTGLKDETRGEYALTTLCTALTAEKDPGSRYMLAGLVRDIGLAHESLAVVAAAAISGALGREKDPYARNAEKNSLMALGMKYEAAGAVAVAGISKAVTDEADPYTRILLANDLRDMGLKYASQALAVVTSLGKAGQKEKEVPAMSHIAQNIAAIAQRNQQAVSPAIAHLSAGVARETRSDAVAAWSHGLMLVGEKHPLPVIVAMETDYASFKGTANKDKHRNYICNLSNLANIGKPEAEACRNVLLGALKDESEAYHRRLIIDGLMGAVRNGIDASDVKEGLKEQLSQEKDRETREKLERSLRSLGYVKPSTNVVTFPA